MSAIPPAAIEQMPGAPCDRVIIQTYEGDCQTMTLRLTATIVTSMDELRVRVADAAGT